MNPIDPPIEHLKKAVFGKSQEQYLALPVRVDDNGAVVSCWQLSWAERLRLFLTGRLFLTTLTFKYKLQPFKLSVDINEVLRDLQVAPMVEVQDTKVKLHGEAHIGTGSCGIHDDTEVIQKALDQAAENAKHEKASN